MRAVKSLQKKIQQEAATMSWSRFFKSMRVEDRIKKYPIGKISLSEFKKQWQGNKITIHTFTSAPQSWQKKYIKYFKAQEKMDKFLLGICSNHFIVEIDEAEDGLIYWENPGSHILSVLIILKKNTRAHIIEKNSKKKSNFYGQNIMVEVGQESRCTYSLLFSQDKDFTHLYYRAFILKQADYKWQLSFAAQAQLSGSVTSLYLQPGGQSHLLAAGNFQKNSQTNLLLTNNHISPHTSGDMLFVGLGSHQAKAQVSGFIKISSAGAFTNSYLTENILLLSDRAKVVAIPTLEILNNEVKASHGATVGRVDEQAVFYLLSRGLTRQQAIELIVSGFFQQVFAKINKEKVRQEFIKSLGLYEKTNKK